MRILYPRYFIVLTLLSLVVPVWAKKYAPPRHSQKAEDPAIRSIRQAYASMDAGWASQNVNLMVAYTSPDFVYTKVNGQTMDRAQYADLTYKVFVKIASLDGLPTVMSGRSTLDRIAMSSQEIIIDRSEDVALSHPPSPPFGVRKTKYRDVWVRLDQGWRLRQETVTSLWTDRKR